MSSDMPDTTPDGEMPLADEMRWMVDYASAEAAEDNRASREGFGGEVGGAVEKDKLFLFVAGEYFLHERIGPGAADAFVLEFGA